MTGVRVAIDCRYVRRAPSGIGTYVRALLDRLPADRGMEFVLWAHREAPRPMTPSPNAEEVVVRAGPNSPLSLLCPCWVTSFDGIDLLHVPSNVLPRGVPCRTVVTVQDVLALDFPRLNRPGFERALDVYYPRAVMRALRQSTRIVVTTDATADRVRAWAPDAVPRLRVIPLAASPVFRRPDDVEIVRARARALLGDDVEYVLAVGEDMAHKGHGVAIDAFAAAAPPSRRLVLLQRRGSAARVQRMAARAGIGDRVVFLRDVADQDVAVLMQGAAALIQPSRYEGFGLPVLEAMACGCPVIASDIPAIREVTAGAAALVAPGDVGAFAAALCRLTKPSAERQELVDRGLARARCFSWDTTARQTWDVYEEAARA